MYNFKFSVSKIAIMLIIGCLCYDLAGQLTRWLYEHDVFIVLCFIFIIWGFSFFPVWIVDWISFKFNKWLEDEGFERKSNKNQRGDYIHYKETRKK